jgi:RNA polymerase sigma-70 factor (ECF subfamily)
MTARALFDEIAREHDAMIKRIASTHEMTPHLAEELVQDIYVAIWKALPSFRKDASLRTFVARIATNRAVTHVVRALKLPRPAELRDDLPTSDDSPETKLIAQDRKTHLLAAVRRLPLTFRAPAMLALEGLTPGEIADVLGISANAVAIRLSRGKELLRTLLEKTR